MERLCSPLYLSYLISSPSGVLWVFMYVFHSKVDCLFVPTVSLLKRESAFGVYLPQITSVDFIFLSGRKAFVYSRWPCSHFTDGEQNNQVCFAQVNKATRRVYKTQSLLIAIVLIVQFTNYITLKTVNFYVCVFVNFIHHARPYSLNTDMFLS